MKEKLKNELIEKIKNMDEAQLYILLGFTNRLTSTPNTAD